MSSPSDFIVVDVPSMLAQKVTISDASGDERPDQDWNREAAATQYVFAEFLQDKGLLLDGVAVGRHPDLRIRWMQLTERGQQFTRSDFHKWLVSVDQSGVSEAKMREKLDKRWMKFSALNPSA